MKNRLSLIIDLESFHKELTELDDRNNFVNRNKYFELMQRVEKLSEADFESIEKYNWLYHLVYTFSIFLCYLTITKKLNPCK